MTKAWIWERPIDSNGNPIEDWAIPGAEIANMLRDLWRNKLTVQAIAFDPAFITWLAQELTTEGLPMFEWPQTDNRMVPATQAAYETVIKGILAHDGDPVLTRHVRSAIAVQTFRGGQRITKGKTKRKIDATVALLMALDMLKRADPPRGPSIDPDYRSDERGAPEMAGVRGKQF
jgi:phage terminase large subunit-like protein